ncbi:hypothetical protein C7444_115111 [Sphaerotilus hippei]|uniref:Uncharacterized protein n=1 Tax=Sphaerotilus hippei TaxID=744406 RepID=A0A318H8D7_9BURK|nr:hypothetical protein [Sphaerotilus hippei]PXW94216.1 hypothetical protein C7444_115111 [Sphaerotilus hippei]
MDALNHCRFVDLPTAQDTADALTDRTSVELAPGVTLHTGHRQGMPTFVITTAGADDLSAVIAEDLADE